MKNEPRPMPSFTKENRVLVRAGTKTMSRRLLKPQPPRENPNPPLPGMPPEVWPPQRNGKGCRYGKVGDICYLREPLKKVPAKNFGDPKARGFIACYADDEQPVKINGVVQRWKWKRKILPQLYMPRVAARTFAQYTMVRGEWLQEITEQDAIMEGCKAEFQGEDRERIPAIEVFQDLWDSINKSRRHGWEKNEFVFVLGWKMLTTSELENIQKD